MARNLLVSIIIEEVTLPRILAPREKLRKKLKAKKNQSVRQNFNTAYDAFLSV